MRMLRIDCARWLLAGFIFLAAGAFLSVWAGDTPDKSAENESDAKDSHLEFPKEAPSDATAEPAAADVKPVIKAPGNAKKTEDSKTAPESKEVAVPNQDAGADTTANIPADPDHRIAPTETIRIDVYDEPRMTAPELRVQAGGKVKYYLIGDVDVGGKTAIEAADLIRQRLIDEGYYVDPQVIVTVIQYRKRYVYVQGDVVRPGPVSLEGEIKLDILGAIGQAQGLTRAANKKKIQFIRKGKIQILNLDKLNKNTDPKNKIYVEPDDTIFVPQNLF